jgi:hypothetical protein
VIQFKSKESLTCISALHEMFGRPNHPILRANGRHDGQDLRRCDGPGATVPVRGRQQ